MDIISFVKLTSRAWSIPILACMHEGVAGRQAPLLMATGASRTAFAQSMNHLISLGFLERNPGYGHPLRPEFRLTSHGVAAAAIAGEIQRISENRNQDLLRRSWTLPVLILIHRPLHFNQIKRSLPTITDRALSQSLKSMELVNWASRSVDLSKRPPGSLYQAINEGGIISTTVASQITLEGC